MNDIVQFQESKQLSAVDIRAQVNLVQQVMQAVMKKETHYGVIPGTKKPTLYKAGAEVLCATFRIADRYEVEDLTVDGMARFRVRCIGTHQTSGIVLGEGMGECSSHEEKYKWRAAICQEEFDGTPDNLRRMKYSKYQGKVEKKQQVRTESADQANTILKMACKRAKIAMTLNATAASDCFTQDVEDLPEELRNDEDEAPTLPADQLASFLAAIESSADQAAGKAVYLQAVAACKPLGDVASANLVKDALLKKFAPPAAPKPPVDDAFIREMEAAEAQ